MLPSSRILRILLVVIACAAFSACAANSNKAGSIPSEMSNGTVACGSKNAPPCVPIPTTRVLTSPCGDITTEFLSEALGRSVNLEGSDSTGCAFTAGDLRLTLSVDVYNPGGIPGFGLPGDPTPNQYRVTNDRSGYWYAVGHSLGYQWVLVNYGRGSDTYPNTEGPEQRPIVSAAAEAFSEAVAKLRPPD